jgi:precorrin-2 dehydrogenase/sirohydrochlorin ferrochelatase
VVVGGGRVGRHKAEVFLAAGARVRLIDPHCATLDPPVGVEILCRAYQEDDLAGALLVVAATDQPEINRQVAADARQRELLVSVVDNSSPSDFSLPAVRGQGSLRLAVSTSGRSPAMAGLVADHLAATLESGWELAVEIAGCLRAWQLTHSEHPAYNPAILRQLINQGLVEQLSARRFDLVDQLLEETCGAGCTLDALGLKLPRDYDR